MCSRGSLFIYKLVGNQFLFRIIGFIDILDGIADAIVRITVFFTTLTVVIEG